MATKNGLLKTHLLAMSFDGPASPSVQFADVPDIHVAGRVPCGWGFAWYPQEDSAAAIVKDPTSTGDDAMVGLLHDWSRFRSTVFLSFVLGAALRRTQQDTHPFVCRYAGRDWLLTHNGTLRDFRAHLPLGSPPLFEPAGRTDSEHVLCWILTQLREAGARTFAELGWVRLHALFRTINESGTANLVLTDGYDLVGYRDRTGFQSLYWTRRLPQPEPSSIRLGLIRLGLGEAQDANRTVILFSSRAPEDGTWEQIPPGQMLVARRARITWDSARGGRQSVRRTVTAPVIGDVGLRLPEPLPRAPSSPLTLPRRRREDHRGRELRVWHETVYRYAEPVEKSLHTFRLMPVHDLQQDVLDHQLEVSVRGLHRNYEDVFGNQSTQVEVDEPFTELRIAARSRVRILTGEHDALEYPNRRQTIPLVWMPWHRQMMSPYLLPEELPETQLLELSEFAMGVVERCDYDLIETVTDLNHTIHQDFEYVSASTTLETTAYEVYARRRGVCQDFANLFICLARLLNIPARYRVGYIHTGADYANRIQSEASHAWAELYLPEIGWRGFDPTNGCLAGPDHVRVACGRNFRDATPTSGTIFKGGGAEGLTVEVSVEAT